MYDVILYAALAAIVCAVFYSILGKSVGHGSDDPINLDKFHAKPDTAPSVIDSPIFEGPAGQGLRAISGADAGFNPEGFLDGAKGAYGMILEAYASADRETLNMLLAPSVYDAYNDAIRDREAQNLSQSTDLARIISAEIVDANRVNKVGEISVKFVAELATAMRDEDDNIVEGDPNSLARVTEIWRFERRLGSSNPNWLLSDVEADDMGMSPDNAPDTA